MSEQWKRRQKRELAARKAGGLKALRLLAEAHAGKVPEGEVPEWIMSALKQAEAEASPGSLPAAAIRPEGSRPDDALVVMRLPAFVRQFSVTPQGGDGSEETFVKSPTHNTERAFQGLGDPNPSGPRKSAPFFATTIKRSFDADGRVTTWT
jgi:hypothetical protein